MYRVDFIDKDNFGLVYHSLSLFDGLDEIKISADKIAGSDYFAKEPKRVEFNCFKDIWIETNILSGDFEHSRYISTFEIRLYDNNNLIFHGIIDTSFCSYNAKTEIVSFTCYDKLRLFVKFADLKMLYSLMNGYHSGYCFGYLAQGIENKIDISVPVQWNGTYSPLTIQVEDINILTFKWKELLKTFEDWTIYSFIVGFTDTSGIPELRFIVKGYQFDDDNQKAKIVAKKWKFYNHICQLHIEGKDIDEETDWFEYSSELQNEISNICTHYNGAVQQSFSSNGNTYSIIVSNEDMLYDTAPEEKSAFFAGNAVPQNIFPKGFYENGGEQTERLKVLKVVLLLHNLTIISDQYGNLKLQNKNDTSNTIVPVDTTDIVEFKRKRINRSQPNTEILDIFFRRYNCFKTDYCRLL